MITTSPVEPVTLRQAPIRRPRGILYFLLLLAVVVSLPLGMVAAAMGAWFSAQAGSLAYLPLGVIFLLAGLAILRSRSVADFIFLLFLTCALIAWSTSGIDAKSRMLTSVAELPGRIDLLLGLLVLMVVALLIVHWQRLFSGSSRRSRLVWVGIPLLLLTAGSASFGSLVLTGGFVR